MINLGFLLLSSSSNVGKEVKKHRSRKSKTPVQKSSRIPNLEQKTVDLVNMDTSLSDKEQQHYSHTNENNTTTTNPIKSLKNQLKMDTKKN